MKFSWIVPGKILSVVVREVCNEIIDEYTDEVTTPQNDPEECKAIADQFMRRLHFHIAVER